MTSERIKDIFGIEFAILKDKGFDDIDVLVEFMEKEIPEYFWKIPASSSGRYHPNIALGDGGLVRHTKMVCAVFEELVRLEQFKLDNYSHVIGLIACILHDSFKNGEVDCGHTVDTHPIIAAEKFYKFITKLYPEVDTAMIDSIYSAIAKHMGQWSCHLCDLLSKRDVVANAVHLTDYIASRKFLNSTADELYIYKEDAK